jgi:predicted esterase
MSRFPFWLRLVRGRFNVAIVLILIGAIVLGATPAATAASDADSRCGPFGDPPAQQRRGFFANFVSAHNPICIGGATLGPWTDSGGADRYACLYEPATARAESPLPLVVFLHGSLATADSILVTSLKGLIGQSDLEGTRPGFILLAPEGRNTTHYYPGFDSTGLGWDTWYRQFSPGDVTIAGVTYAENVDAAAIDHFVDEEVSSGKVDRRRIYLTGWSNGAAMALLYALNRPWVAAAAVYSAPSPFGAFDDPCPQVPRGGSAAGNTEVEIANPRLPIMHVRNSCDIGGICPNGNALAVQIRALGGDFVDVILDSSGNPAGGCEDSCGTNPMGGGSIGWWNELKGAAHHASWPKRSNDAMLDFLKRHPFANR